MSWKKLTEKLACLNRCLFLATQSPRKTRCLVFLAVLALRSGGYIETCDIYREKHSCRCYGLPELHKTISVPPRPFDTRDATIQSRDLKHTKCHHLDPNEVGVHVFEIVDSGAVRFSILNAVSMGTTDDQSWIVRESETLGSPSSHACLRAFVHGWTRWAGWPKLVRCDRGTHKRCVFWFDSCQERCGDQTCWIRSARTDWKSRTTRCHAQEKDVESHQGHATLQADNRWT